MRMLERLYENDRWMQFGLIHRESHAAGHLYNWSQQIFEFIQIANHMQNIGIKEIEEKIQVAKQREENS